MKNTTSIQYMLRTCEHDMSSYCGFIWPKAGPVECSDWDAAPICGGGLHGLLWGAGDLQMLSRKPDAQYLVVAVNADDILDLNGKVKAPRGWVVYCGDRDNALQKIIALGADPARCIYAQNTAGNYNAAITQDGGHSVAGYHSIAKAGAYGTAETGDAGLAQTDRYGKSIAGYKGHAITGDNGIARSGYAGYSITGNGGLSESEKYGKSLSDDYGKSITKDYGFSFVENCGRAETGYSGTAIAGKSGIAKAGDCGRAIAGDKGRAIAGASGIAIAGYQGIAVTGDYGRSMAGFGGIVQSGENGIIQLDYLGKRPRSIMVCCCTAIGYIGENGLKPNTQYHLNDQHVFEEITYLA